MTVDEAKAVAEKVEAPYEEIWRAIEVLAAAVRDDDLVVAPEGVSVTDNSRHRIIHGMIYCFRSDLPKPVRTVRLFEYFRVRDNIAEFRWFVEGFTPPPSGFRRTGQERTIEVDDDE